MAASIHTKHLCLFGNLLLEKPFRNIAVLSADLLPEQPLFPPVREGIGVLDGDLAALLPVMAPPVRAVEAAEIPGPVGSEMVRDSLRKLLLQSRNDDADEAALSYKPGKVADVEVVGPKIVV